MCTSRYLLIALLLAAGHAAGAADLAANADDETAAQPAGVAPLYFERNVGQASAPVEFLARGGGHVVYLAPDAAVVALRPACPDCDMPLVRTRLVGGAPAPKMSGEVPLPGRSHYLDGKDPERWHRNVPHYARVHYEAVYPGIDLVYHGSDGNRIEYDFIVAPGIDPGRIRIEIDGAESMRVGEDGDLLLEVPGGQLVQRRPVAYQAAEPGGGARVPVGAQYRLAENTVTFELDDYDPARPLVIDPVLVYGTYLGGNNNDFVGDVAVDTSGNTYVVGHTFSSDFPVTGGALQTAKSADEDIYVTKISTDGTTLLYSTYLGGDNDDQGLAIAVDGAGLAYVAGTTTSDDFPVSAGAFQPARAGGLDVVVSRLNVDGSALDFSTHIGGLGIDTPLDLALTASGNAVIVGNAGVGYPTTSGAFDETFNGGIDAIVTQLNADASALVYSTFLGTTATDVAQSVAVDAAGAAYVTGRTESVDFPTTAGAFQETVPSGGNAFVAKLDAAGAALVYSTFLGGTDAGESGYGIAVDANGVAYAVGVTIAPDFPTTAGAFQVDFGGGFDSFVTALDIDGSGLLYSTYLGGAGADTALDVVVSSAGEALVIGRTDADDFPTTPDALKDVVSGATEGFATKLDAAGSTLIYSTLYGGDGADEPRGAALHPDGDLVIAGETESSDFPVTPGVFQPTSAGSRDAFLLRLEDTSPPVNVLQLSAADYATDESAGETVVTVTRSGSAGAVSVDVATSDGTATAGSDYAAVATTVSFADGESAPRTVSIPIVPDMDVEDDETFDVTLSNAVGATLGPLDTATVTITDDDMAAEPSAGTLQLSAGSYATNETAGSLTIVVTREGGDAGAVSVDIASSDGTATAGSDYTALAATVDFADGDTAGKSVTFAVLDDGDDEADETATVTLSNATGGATLGTPSTATVTIADDDAPSEVDASAEGSYGSGAVDRLALLALLLMAAWRLRANRRLVATLCVVLLAVPAAPSVQAAEPGWYVGARAGESVSSLDAGTVRDRLGAQGHDVAVELDEDRFGGALYGGYRFSQYLAVEGALLDLGEFDVSIAGSTPNAGTFANDVAAALGDGGTAVSISVRADVPLSERFHLTPRLGVYHWRSETDLSLGSESISIKNDGVDITGGLGVSFVLTPGLTAGVGWDRYAHSGRNEIDIYALQVEYRLGR